MSLTITLLDKLDLSYKQSVEVSEQSFIISQSVKGLNTSSFTCDTQDVLNVETYDYLVIYLEGITLLGRVSKIDVTSSYSTQISFYYNHEIYQRMEIIETGSNEITNYTINNYQPIQVKLKGVHSFIATDNDLTSDAIIRQVMRKQQFNASFSDNTVSLEPVELEPLKLRLDDINIPQDSVIIELEDDVVNEVTVVLKSDLLRRTTWYKHNDGTIDNVRSDNEVYYNVVVVVEEEAEVDNISIAKEQFKLSDYSNSISFAYINDNSFFELNTLLGRQVNLYIPQGVQTSSGVFRNDIVIETIISEYTYTMGRLDIYTGLSSKKLIDLLGGI